MLLSLQTKLFAALKALFCVSFVNRMRDHAAMSSDRLCFHFRPPTTDNVTIPFPVNFRKLVVIWRHVQEFLQSYRVVNKPGIQFATLCYPCEASTSLVLLRIQNRARGVDLFAFTKVTTKIIFPPCNFRFRAKRSLCDLCTPQ